MVEVPTPAESGGTADLTIRLEPGGSARGTVRLRDGSPVSGAVVYLVSEDDEIARTEPLGFIPWSGTSPRVLAGRTDRAGRFAIEGLAFRARYAALAHRSDLGRAVDVTGLWVGPERRTVAVNLVFPRPSSLVIRVRHEDGTIPLDSGLEIDGRRVPGPAVDGVYEVAGLAPKTYVVRAWAQGHLSTTERIEVPEEVRVERVLVLRKEISISGTVVDERGEPLATGFVREDVSADGSRFHLVRDGKFRLSEIDIGPHRLTPTDEWFVPIGDPTAIEAPTNDARLTTTGRQIGTVRLAVPAGFEVPRYMRVEWSDDGRPRRANSRGKDGAFRFGLMRGRTRLRFAPDDFLAFERVLDVQAGGAVDLGEVLLDPGVPLTGRVVDRRNRPIANAAVEGMIRIPWSHSTAQTALDGSFRLTGHGRDAVVVEASAEGYFPTRVERSTSDFGAPLTIVLKVGGTIRGRLVDADGRGVAAQEVLVVDPGARDGLESSVATDPKGRFTLRCPSGRRTLAVYRFYPHPGPLRLPLATVDVEDEEETMVEVRYSPP